MVVSEGRGLLMVEGDEIWWTNLKRRRDRRTGRLAYWRDRRGQRVDRGPVPVVTGAGEPALLGTA